jgi:hypothetical protein
MGTIPRYPQGVAGPIKASDRIAPPTTIRMILSILPMFCFIIILLINVKPVCFRMFLCVQSNNNHSGEELP